MLATLDTETQQEWEINTTSRTDTPATAELITLLESRCRALELLQATQSLKTTPVTPRSQSTGGKVSKHSYSNVATQLQCPLCNGSHRLFKCDRFLKMQPKQCLSHAKQSKLCFSCLQSFTKNSKQVCHQCHKRHHTLLHIDEQNQPTNDKGPAMNNNQSADANGSTTAEVNTYCSLKDKPRNHILLATAIVEVRINLVSMYQAEPC